MVKPVRAEIGRPCAPITAAGCARIIGSAGTILSRGAVAATMSRGAPPPELRNLRIPAKQIRRVRKAVTRLALEQRLSMPGLDPRRADLVVAGSILLDTTLRRLDGEDITLCDFALREGLVLDYVHRNQRKIARVDRIPDVRRRSVVELAERCHYNAAHAHHVARLALALFDQTRAIHGLTDRERDWLEYAALMHDVGGLISYVRHHRHSYYLIKNGDLRGFDPEETEVMALVARYHRRGTPKTSHDEYAGLTGPLRRTVRFLASALRVAESLDRSHAQVISGLEVHDRGEAILLRIQTRGDAELEVWAADRHLRPFERFVRKPIRLELAATADRPPEREAERGAPPARRRNTDLTGRKRPRNSRPIP
jgi:exopolyphosphatase/guanosine-5'-triphosphate,3'-diphosphate pyrophosphatase